MAVLPSPRPVRRPLTLPPLLLLLLLLMLPLALLWSVGHHHYELSWFPLLLAPPFPPLPPLPLPLPPGPLRLPWLLLPRRRPQ